MDVDITPLDKDAQNWISAGNKTISYFNSVWPVGMTNEAGKCLQNYIMGEISKDQFFVSLDDAYRKLGAY